MALEDSGPVKAGHTAHGAAQRQALVQAAFDLIAEGGFERLRTRDVAARAGVNIATLHYYFATKEDLIRGVVLMMRELFSETNIRPAHDSSLRPAEQLHKELSDSVETVRTQQALFVVLFELQLRSMRDPAIREIVIQLHRYWNIWLKSLIVPGLEEGAFRSDLDADAGAYALSSFMMGVSMGIMLDPENFPADRAAAEIERWITVAPSASC